MGYDATALTFLGVRLNLEDIFKPTKTRGCEHKLTKKNEKDVYCRLCGKPMWIEEDCDDPPDTINGLELKRMGSDDSVAYFLGRTINKTSYSNKIVRIPWPESTDQEIEETISETLRKKKVENAVDIMKSFGLYTILDESY